VLACAARARGSPRIALRALRRPDVLFASSASQCGFPPAPSGERYGPRGPSYAGLDASGTPANGDGAKRDNLGVMQPLKARVQNDGLAGRARSAASDFDSWDDLDNEERAA